MCYFCHQKCGCNNTHTSGFHAAWKRDTGTFALPDDHEIWKLSGKTASVTNGTGASEGGGTSILDQLHLALSEVISCHQVNTSDTRFSSFLTDFSKVLGNLNN